jgi:hypothetical protein
MQAPIALVCAAALLKAGRRKVRRKDALAGAGEFFSVANGSSCEDEADNLTANKNVAGLEMADTGHIHSQSDTSPLGPYHDAHG